MNKKNSFLVAGLSAVVIIGALTGCAISEGKKARETGRTMDQYRNDKIVSARVSEALQEAQVYKFPDVHVEAYDGTVQLSGFVPTEAQKREAEQIARNTPGVTRVIDNLALVPQNPTPTGREQGYQNTPPNAPANPNAPVVQPR
ncbi:MAG TPA: BON domain-containing protein [Candidatus Limnocylindrales bacterium]|nr:BON domain-containing protein [Candidatus Limnocylindrales bacterium]